MPPQKSSMTEAEMLRRREQLLCSSVHRQGKYSAAGIARNNFEKGEDRV